MCPCHLSKVAIKEPTPRCSASAISTNAVLSIAPRMSSRVSVTLGDIPVARHNGRSASAFSGRHSRMKNGFGDVSLLPDKAILPFFDSVSSNLSAIRQASSSYCANSCRPLRSAIRLPAAGVHRVSVDSLDSPKPTRVRRFRPARLSRFGASCSVCCRQ